MINKTATTITVNWTAVDSSDADGYVVNVTSDTDTVQTVQVEGSSNNTITLNGLRRGTTYNITVRAYVTSDADTVQRLQLEDSSNDAIILNGGTTYNITVRTYQQLLGPASSTIGVTTNHHCQDKGALQ